MFHPVGVRVVGITSRRADILMTLFFIFSLHLYINKDSKPANLTSAFLYIMSVLSKESSLLLCPIYPLYSFYNSEGGVKSRVKSTVIDILPFSTLGILYTFLRFRILKDTGGTDLVDIDGIVTSAGKYGVSHVHGFQDFEVGVFSILFACVMTGLSLSITAAYIKQYVDFSKLQFVKVQTPIICLTSAFIIKWINIPNITNLYAGTWERLLFGMFFGPACLVIIMSLYETVRERIDKNNRFELIIAAWIILPGLTIIFGYGYRYAYITVACYSIFLATVIIKTVEHIREENATSSTKILSVLLVFVLAPFIATNPLLLEDRLDKPANIHKEVVGELNQVDQKQQKKIVSNAPKKIGKNVSLPVIVSTAQTYEFVLTQKGYEDDIDVKTTKRVSRNIQNVSSTSSNKTVRIEHSHKLG
jgi:hypothetical protein